MNTEFNVTWFRQMDYTFAIRKTKQQPTWNIER